MTPPVAHNPLTQHLKGIHASEQVISWISNGMTEKTLLREQTLLKKPSLFKCT